MAETLDTFFAALCRRMGWEPTKWRINVLKTMAQMEGYPTVIRLEQTWNPLDTMHPAGAVGNWNTAGVKIYPNLAAGVEATARTLEQPNFSNLRETLETQQVNEGTAADLRLWGWHSPNLLNTILNAMAGEETMTTLPGRETVGPETALASRAKPVTPGQAGARVSLGEWLEQQGYAAPFPEDWAQPPGSGGIEWFNQLPAAMKESIYNEWARETGRGAEAGITPLEREEIEARTAVNWANAQEIIARLGGDRYEDERNRILDKIDQENWTAEMAIKEFNAWMSGALEAGKRAETVYGEEMKRKVWTTPGEYYPGTEPGGISEKMYERYGLEYKPSPGIAVETLPNLQDMYGQWHGRMGISEQAPPTQGGWSGQGAPMGGQPTGAAAAQAFLERLFQQHAPQFGAGRA